MATLGVWPEVARVMSSRPPTPAPYGPLSLLRSLLPPLPSLPSADRGRLQTISAAYSLPPGALTQQNVWLNCAAPLTAGTVLVIGNTAVPPGSVTYVTQSSETCTYLASLSGITLALLQQYNPAVYCSNLQLGTNLVLPSVLGNKIPPVSPPTCASVYTVTPGDTCASIAVAVGLNATTLMR